MRLQFADLPDGYREQLDPDPAKAKQRIEAARRVFDEYRERVLLTIEVDEPILAQANRDEVFRKVAGWRHESAEVISDPSGPRMVTVRGRWRMNRQPGGPAELTRRLREAVRLVSEKTGRVVPVGT